VSVQASAHVEPGWSLTQWREAARRAIAAGIAPDDLHWHTDDRGDGTLLSAPDLRTLATPTPSRELRVPKAFVELAGGVLCHRDPARHALLYRMLWRMASANPNLMHVHTDADTRRAMDLAKQVNRDCHKMKAFVRFRAVPGVDNEFVAWFEPDHYIVDRVAPFFARRFSGMSWAILTPYRSVRWDGATLEFGPGRTRTDTPADDASEALWQVYYANIFNPARLNPRLMEKEMPRRYWGNLPEVQQLPMLLRDAGARVRGMMEREAEPARRKLPPRRTTGNIEPPLAHGLLNDELQACRRCPLWQDATQPVPGSGRIDARTMVVGEQPDDLEDVAGALMLGEAGRLLLQLLEELGVSHEMLYFTAALKHLTFRRQGARRLTATPDIGHVNACRIWLQREIETIRPQRIITLGAVALRAVLGKNVELDKVRGTAIDHGGMRVHPTIHPGWVLAQQRDRQPSAYAILRHDITAALATAKETASN
jgi:probable DNA metabolism protein